MRMDRNLLVGLVVAVLTTAASSWAGQTESGIGSPYDSGVVQLYGDSQSTGASSDFGRIQLYQFNGPSGTIQPGLLYRFGSPDGYAPLQGVTPMIAVPSMRGVPLVPVVPLVPILPNAGMAPVVPNIGVITPGQAPGSSTWGHGR